jgi:PAS domain S-box-containing protein
MHQDRKNQDRIEHMLNIQRDIEYFSWMQDGLSGSLDYILTKLTEVDWIDAGGVYLVDEEKNLIQLACHLGLSDEFLRGATAYDPSTNQYEILQKKEKIYIKSSEIIDAGLVDVIAEGLTFLAVLPLVHGHQLIGSLNLASRRIHEINDHDKFLAESIASRVASMVVYIRTQDDLRKSWEGLSQKVKDRTQEVEKMNQKLKNEIKVHKKTKRALEISENLYRTIFNNAQDGIVLYNARTLQLVDLNYRAHEDLGYTRNEFLKLEASDFTIYEYEGQREEILEKLFREKYVVYNVKHLVKNGEVKFRIMNASMLSIDRQDYILGIIHDVTRLKLAENELVQTQRSYREMVERISIGLFRFDSKRGIPVFLNNYARQLIGIGTDEDISKISLSQFGLRREYMFDLLKQLGIKGELKNHEMWLTRRDGSKFLSSINLGLFESDVKKDEIIYVDGTIEDVTALRQAQTELELANKLNTEINNSLKQRIEDAMDLYDKQQAAMLQKSKLESLGELAAGIAHEINQPVGIISLAMENLKTRFESGTVTPKYLYTKFEGITEHINRIRKIIENIRIFSRDQTSLTLEKVFLNRIVKKAVSLIRTQYQAHNVGLEMHLNDSNEFTVGSRVKVEQVIYNLLSNAKYAVDERETLTNDPGYQKKIRIASGVEGNNRLFLEVSDNGTGIPEQNMKKIFDPFFSTKNEFKGTGLGLSVVFGIVHEMKGVINVESEVNKFTKFKIIFPMYPEKD